MMPLIDGAGYKLFDATMIPLTDGAGYKLVGTKMMPHLSAEMGLFHGGTNDSFCRILLPHQ